MKQGSWIAGWLCAVLLFAASARADDAPLRPLAGGGAKFGLLGALGGVALSVPLLFVGASRGHTDMSGPAWAAGGILLTALALPFAIAGGVKHSARQEGYEVRYGRALGGAWLGAASYGLFILPGFLDGQRRLANTSLAIGGVLTTFITAPLLSAWLARKDARSRSTEPSRAVFGLGYGASF